MLSPLALLVLCLAGSPTVSSVRPNAIPLIPGTPSPVFKITLDQDIPQKPTRARLDPHPAVSSTGLKRTGDAEFTVTATLSADTPLNKSIRLTLHSLELADGTTIPTPKTHTFRPAYPLHRRGEHNCHTTRIPAITRTNDGTLLAVYDLRYNSAKDLQEHIDIGLSRSTDGGQTWEKPRPVMDMAEFGGKPQKENGCSDPNILVDPRTGKIFVAAVWTHGKPNTHQWRSNGSEPGFELHQSSQFMVVSSTDDGLTWSAPENWTRQLKNPGWHLFAPCPGNGIALTDGTLVMPAAGRDDTGLPFSTIISSRDHGQSWNVAAPARRNTNECAVAELSDGSLILSMRDNRNRKDKSKTNGRAISTTTDRGRTWSKHPADHGALPEPVCMASLISHTLPDGRHLLLFSNPHHKNSRRNITIQASLDDGLTWPEKHHILLDQGTGKGYSSLVMVDEETIGIIYESSQANLVFQLIPLNELQFGL